MMSKEALDETEESDTIESTNEASESLWSFIFLDVLNSNAKHKSIPGKMKGFFLKSQNNSVMICICWPKI